MKVRTIFLLIAIFYSNNLSANFLRAILVYSYGGQAFYVMLHQYSGEQAYWHLYRTDGQHIERIVWLQQFGQILWVFFETAIPQTFLYINRELRLICD